MIKLILVITETVPEQQVESQTQTSLSWLCSKQQSTVWGQGSKHQRRTISIAASKSRGRCATSTCRQSLWATVQHEAQTKLLADEAWKLTEQPTTSLNLPSIVVMARTTRIEETKKQETMTLTQACKVWWLSSKKTKKFGSEFMISLSWSTKLQTSQKPSINQTNQ